MKHKNKENSNDFNNLENYSLTREATLKNKSKWEVFLDGYRNHYKTEFSWPEYIKKCKLYYGEFDIKSFINSYGPECEEDFKKFRGEVLEKRGIIKKSPYDNMINAIEFDEKILELMVNGDNLRTRMLISFLNPQSREEKRRLKKSWKKAKKQKQSRAEWMKTYVGIPFKPNELDPLDTKYTRDEIFEMIRDAKKRLNELKFKKNAGIDTKKIQLDISTPSKSVSVSNINELEQLNKGINDLSIFQPTIKFDALTSNKTKDIREEFDIDPNKESKTMIFNNFEDEDEAPIIINKATEPIVDNEFNKTTINLESNIQDDNAQKIKQINMNEFIKVDHEVLDDVSFIKPINDTKIHQPDIEELLTLEKTFNDQLQSIQEDNAKITKELQKVNQIKLEEEKKYEMLRKQREELTRSILEKEDLLK